MPDFVTFNEFIDSTADARIKHHVTTLTAGLRRAAVAAKAEKGSDGRRATAGDADEQFDKMKRYVLEYYEGVKPEHTYLDIAGNFIDCIPFEQQATVRAARAKGLKVPKQPPHTSRDQDRPRGAGARFGPETSNVVSPHRRGGVDLFGNERYCPEGTVPVRRVSLARLAWYGEFERFFIKSAPTSVVPHAKTGRGKRAGSRAKGSAKRTKGKESKIPPPQSGPDGAGHYHAICTTDWGTYYGCSTWLNIWGVDPSPGVFSLSQLWMLGTKPVADGLYATIESGWMVDSPDGHPYLFVFYNPDGYANYGKPGARSGYVNNVHLLGFIPYPGSSFYPGMLLDSDQISTPGGEQYGLQMGWDKDADGNWWLHAGYGSFERVGCFPAGLYEPASGLSDHAGIVQFGGEVASNGSGYGPMGSGVQPYSNPKDSFGQVAFQKLMQTLPAVGGTLQDADVAEPPNGQDNPGYYTASVGKIDAWGSYLFFGGAHAP